MDIVNRSNPSYLPSNFRYDYFLNINYYFQMFYL